MVPVIGQEEGTPSGRKHLVGSEGPKLRSACVEKETSSLWHGYAS